MITSLPVVMLLLTGCVIPASTPLLEPNAGHWQTWVVTDLAGVLPSAPPVQAAGIDSRLWDGRHLHHEIVVGREIGLAVAQ